MRAAFQNSLRVNRRGFSLVELAVVVGVLGLLAALPFYIASGLVAPLWAILALWAAWLSLGLLALRWFRSHPWVVLVLPLVAAGVWWLSLTLGEQLLDWQA